ncbi:MAG: TetR/AcrR family transcriptional regulator [Myxococcales bacterium]|nr:TetR/AcrR family transcriptional regulator [Myxococcales bacterium]
MPPTTKKPPRASYHHGDVARAIRDEALARLREGGPESLSLRELARAIGVSHAAVYRHYEDKDALLAAVAEDGWRGLIGALSSALAAAEDASPRERLVRLGSAYVEFALTHPAHYRVMTGPRLDEAKRFPTLEAPVQESFLVLFREIERARASGVFASDRAEDWALRVWMFAHGYVTLVVARRVPVKREKTLEYFRTLLGPLLG